MGFPNIPAFYHADSPHKGYLSIKARSFFIKKSKIIDLLTSEQALREETQRMETLQQHLNALRKTQAIECDAFHDTNIQNELEKTEKKVKKHEERIARKQYDLYQAECMISRTCKAAYDELRCDATWYMRKGLVQDCKDRGGCCSRKCGCCAQRHLSGGQKGIGHCTLQCGCCKTLKAFDYTHWREWKLKRDFRGRLEAEKSPQIIQMADWFFCPLTPKSLPKQKP